MLSQYKLYMLFNYKLSIYATGSLSLLKWMDCANVSTGSVNYIVIVIFQPLDTFARRWFDCFAFCL